MYVNKYQIKEFTIGSGEGIAAVLSIASLVPGL
jgi:hypothetical protein